MQDKCRWLAWPEEAQHDDDDDANDDDDACVISPFLRHSTPDDIF